MPLMGSLYIGASGLLASQGAMNIASNNLANVETKGYTRQQVVFGNAIYNTLDKTKAIGWTQTGLGVNIDEVRQVRDRFLDEAYRMETGRQAFYAKTYEAVEEIETLFGELEGVELQAAMTDLWNAMSEVAKNPNDATQLALLKDKANSFVTRCNSVAIGLKDYQQNVNLKIEETIDRINELGENIYQLNLDICKIEAGGIENANDLRDLRNAALDELGSLIKISYKEDDLGMIRVRAEGQDFITKAGYWKMEASYDPHTELTTPIWPHLGKNVPVFTYGEEIRTAFNTDVGGLKAYVLARGDVQANYFDIPVKPEPEDYAGGLSDPVYLAAVDIFDRFSSGENIYEPNARDFAGGETDPAYLAAKDAYDRLSRYETYTSASVINRVQAEFDQMFHSVAQMFNDILCPNKQLVTDDGTEVTVLDEEATSYGANGQIGVELFSRNGYERYKKQTLTVNGEEKEYYVYNEEIEGRRNTQYTIGNVSVNPTVMQDASSLPMTTLQGDADYKRAMEMLDKWASPFARLNPYSAAKADYQTYYKQLVGELANLGSVYSNIADALTKEVTFIDNKRLEIAGVSSDEELTNIIRFQNAYNASSRYINVINEMLGHLISQLGMK